MNLEAWLLIHVPGIIKSSDRGFKAGIVDGGKFNTEVERHVSTPHL